MDFEKPIKIAFVLHAMQVAGAEVLVAETIRKLGTRIDPIILCLDELGQLGKRLDKEGVPVIRLGRRPGLDLGVSRRIASEVSRRSIDVVHAHQYTPFFYSGIAKLCTTWKFHLVFTEHGRHYPDLVTGKRRLANRFLLNRCADEINAVCRFSARALSERDGFPEERIQVIENGIDMDRYRPLPDIRELKKRLGLDTARRYILCVARFHPVKDHKTLISAFAQITAKHQDVDLLLAGDGPLCNALKQQTAALAVSQRIRFLGLRDDIPELMQCADVFVLNSLSEAASITIMEAMASSLPIVVTDVGGNPEIVRDGIDGLLVPRENPVETAAACMRLLADRDLARKLAESGRRRVLQKYLLDRTIMEYYRLYSAGKHNECGIDTAKEN